MEEVKCIFKECCSEEVSKCQTCANNKGKKSHYIPEVEPYTPYYPIYPIYPVYPYYLPTITYTTGDTK